jgi:hypothetical protein
MNARVILAATVCLILGLGVHPAHAKKTKAHSEDVDVMCSGKAGKAFVGKLFSIQPAAREITIKTKDGSKEFRIAGSCKMSTSERPEAELTDLKSGEEVRVTYFTTKAETDVASSIAPAKKPVK